ncbi:hypothetical protein [Pseudomonas syringae]|uniref:hypothetical protein n=1 Tax=Pseudomonas syringae TaxID=317 RepID=UPI001F39C10F|nr:hypothetical protein [Pseudomonas syringae]
MNIFGKTCVITYFFSILLTMALASGSYANTDSEIAVGVENNEADDIKEAVQAGPGQEVSEPRFTILTDKLHSIVDVLTSKYPVHYYGFVSHRGQDVLLYSPVGDPVTNPWKTEYYENGEWVAQTLETKVFTKLDPGAEVIIRVMPRNSWVESNLPYTVRLGSYPVLKSYELLDEPGVLRIPSGHTEPQWLATQIYKETVLEVKFIDTKDSPLEGGMAIFGMSFGKNDVQVKRILISGSDGFASERIALGRCYGGVEALDFVDKQMGFNTWRSYYKTALYFVQNLSLGPVTATPHVFYLGHICTQTVLRTVAPRG